MTEPIEQRTDGELVAAALSGCEQAFPHLFQRYRCALLNVARSRLRDEQRAEDAVQETFLSALRSLRTYDSRYSFRTWLWTILLNHCRRNHRRHHRTPSVRGWSESEESVRAAAHPASDAPSPPTVLLARERAELLEQSLDRLPDREADALRLRFYGELKFQEIADAMSCSLGTAKNRVRKGLVRLANIVTEVEALAESADERRTKDEV